jgi:hypothetical protein
MFGIASHVVLYMNVFMLRTCLPNKPQKEEIKTLLALRVSNPDYS